MSHLRYCQLKILNPNALIIKKAVALIAQRHGFTVTDKIIDYYGKQSEAITAMQVAPDRSYGVRITSNQLEVVGDDYNVSYKLQAFQSEVNQVYRALVYQQALQKQGYHTQLAFKGKQIQVVATQ